MAKFKERILARELRNGGESIKIIAKKLGISNGTASLWCSDISLDEEQIEKLVVRSEVGTNLGRLYAAENRKNERLSRVKSFGNIGKEKVGKMNDRDLFMLGVGLYWAEGGKKNREVRFINSDPQMIKLWILWLFRFVGVCSEDLILRIGINQIHRDRIQKVADYWAKIIEVPESQFRSPSLKKVSNHKVYANFEEHYGSLMVSIRRSANLNYQILGMIGAVKNFRG